MDKTLKKMFPDVGGEEKKEEKGPTLDSIRGEPKRMDLEEELKEAIRKCKISCEGIPMSHMGKKILENRMRAEYGGSYDTNMDARVALAKFDNYLEKYKDDAAARDRVAHASAGRTLEMLRKMS